MIESRVAPLAIGAALRVTLDPATGTIKSIYDKARGQELIDSTSSFQANQFIYRPNPEGANKGADTPTSAAGQWSPTAGTVKVLSSGPVSATVQVTQDPGAGGATTGISGLTASITLYAGIPRVFISNTVDKAEVDTAEEAYFAFPFKADNPQITYEVPGASVRFFTDQLPGSALDWQSIQSYADISGSSGGVTFATRDAPLVEFGHIRTDELLTRPGRLDGRTGKIDPAPYLPGNGSVFSYVYNNLWFTNYRIAHAGTTTFDYGITSHAGGFDPVRAAQDGWGYLMPLVPLAVPAGQHGAYQPGSHSLVSVDQPNVIVQTIKQSDAGAPGLALRLLEVAGQSCQATVHLPFQGGAATLDDITERPQSALAITGNVVQVPVDAHGIVTLTVLPELTLTVTVPASTRIAPTPGPNETGDVPYVDIAELPSGQSLPATVTLFNHSHQTLSGSLSLPATDGLSISPASAAFSQTAPGATATSVFTVTAPASQPPGQVTLTATANLGPGQATVPPAKLTLSVVNPVGIAASPTPLQLLETEPAQVTVTVTNNLGQATTATVHLATPSGWAVQPASATITLDPGQSQTTTFTVTPPAGSFGQPTLQVIAQGGGVTKTLSLPASVGKPVAIVGKPGDTSNDQFALAPDQYVTFTGWLLDTNNFSAPEVQARLNGTAVQAVPLQAGGGDGYHWGDGQPNLYNASSPPRSASRCRRPSWPPGRTPSPSPPCRVPGSSTRRSGSGNRPQAAKCGSKSTERQVWCTYETAAVASGYDWQRRSRLRSGTSETVPAP